MKILVFDDSPIHRKSAELTLKGHDVTIVGNYDRAQAALVPKKDRERGEVLFKEKYRNTDPNDCDDPNEKPARRQYYEECMERATIYPDFDAVLTDLLVPASDQKLGYKGERFAGQEMPLGSIIALLAIHAGIKNVAVVTNMGHHDHPASAALDCFSHGVSKAKGVRLICTNQFNPTWLDEHTGEVIPDDFLESAAGKEKYGSFMMRHDRVEGGKNWGQILQRLLADRDE